MSGMMAVWGARSSVARSWAPLSTPITAPAPAAAPGLQVADRVAGHGHGSRIVDPEPLHGPEDQIGSGPTPTHVGRGQGQVDLRTPAERVQQGVPGARGEAGGKAHPHPGGPQVAEHCSGPGNLARPRRWPRSPRRRPRRRRWPGRPRPRRGGRRRRPPWTSPWSRARGSGPPRSGGAPARCRRRPVRHRRPTPPHRRRAPWCRPCPGRPGRSDRSRAHPRGGQRVGRDGGRAGHAATTGPGHHPHRLLDLLAQTDAAVEALGVDTLPAPAHRWQRTRRGSGWLGPAAPRSGPR